MRRLASIMLLAWLVTACAAAPAPDDAAPGFTMTTLDGESVALADFRGRWVLLNFWATWCVPCVEELPLLMAYASDTGMPLLAVNVRESREQIGAFLEEHGLSALRVLTAPADNVLLAYQVIGLPQTVLIDPSGALAWRAFGPLDEAMLAEIDAISGRQVRAQLHFTAA
jgi:cytochrome c biogenesis protein CcmG/thiol:disulfide interchange protein DsbE